MAALGRKRSVMSGRFWPILLKKPYSLSQGDRLHQ